MKVVDLLKFAMDGRISKEKLAAIADSAFLQKQTQAIDAGEKTDNGWRTTEQGKHYKINTKTGQVLAGHIGVAKPGQKVDPAKKTGKAEARKSAAMIKKSTASKSSGREMTKQQALRDYIQNDKRMNEISKQIGRATSPQQKKRLYDLLNTHNRMGRQLLPKTGLKINPKTGGPDYTQLREAYKRYKDGSLAKAAEASREKAKSGAQQKPAAKKKPEKAHSQTGSGTSTSSKAESSGWKQPSKYTHQKYGQKQLTDVNSTISQLAKGDSTTQFSHYIDQLPVGTQITDNRPAEYGGGVFTKQSNNTWTARMKDGDVIQNAQPWVVSSDYIGQKAPMKVTKVPNGATVPHVDNYGNVATYEQDQPRGLTYDQHKKWIAQQREKRLQRPLNKDVSSAWNNFADKKDGQNRTEWINRVAKKAQQMFKDLPNDTQIMLNGQFFARKSGSKLYGNYGGRSFSDSVWDMYQKDGRQYNPDGLANAKFILPATSSRNPFESYAKADSDSSSAQSTSSMKRSVQNKSIRGAAISMDKYKPGTTITFTDKGKKYTYTKQPDKNGMPGAWLQNGTKNGFAVPYDIASAIIRNGGDFDVDWEKSGSPGGSLNMKASKTSMFEDKKNFGDF